MSRQSLQQALQSAESPVSMLRDLGVAPFTSLPDEYSHWIEEQRSWRESCALFDLSYHMSDLRITGPDAPAFYSDYAVNNFEGFEYKDAKQLVVANPDGYLIGDAILVALGDDEYVSVGPEAPHHWLRYNVETGDYDVSAEFQGRPVRTGEDPQFFRYQVQGPDAVPIMEEATDRPLPEIPFFKFDELSIDGHEVHALRHGMAGEPGFEIWGPYEYSEGIKETILDAGADSGIRRVGSQAYQTTPLASGWLPLPLPAIYENEEMADYREWLDAGRGIISIGGSFYSEDITDYYLTPIEVGYGRHIDFDTDFVGKEALEEEMENPRREKVTLVWDDEDVVDVFGSLFDGGETKQFMDLPTPRSAACNYDEVRRDGEHVGVGKWRGYNYNERAMLSIGVLDVEYAEPGTEVTLVWGEAGGAKNPTVERHEQTEVTATVAPVPYGEDRR